MKPQVKGKSQNGSWVADADSREYRLKHKGQESFIMSVRIPKE